MPYTSKKRYDFRLLQVTTDLDTWTGHLQDSGQRFIEELKNFRPAEVKELADAVDALSKSAAAVKTKSRKIRSTRR